MENKDEFTLNYYVTSGHQKPENPVKIKLDEIEPLEAINRVARVITTAIFIITGHSPPPSN